MPKILIQMIVMRIHVCIMKKVKQKEFIVKQRSYRNCLLTHNYKIHHNYGLKLLKHDSIDKPPASIIIMEKQKLMNNSNADIELLVIPN